MMKFTINKSRVTVDPLSLTLRSLKEIWEIDKSRTKEDAIAYLSYVHIVSQLDKSAPFCNVNPSEIESLASKEIFGEYEHKFKKPYTKELIGQAIEDYVRAFVSLEAQVLQVYNTKIFEIIDTLAKEKVEIDKSINKGTVSYVSNFAIINSMLQQINKIRLVRDEIEASVKNDSAKSGEKKGARTLNHLEKRMLEKQSKLGKIRDSETDDGDIGSDGVSFPGEETEEL